MKRTGCWGHKDDGTDDDKVVAQIESSNLAEKQWPSGAWPYTCEHDKDMKRTKCWGHKDDGTDDDKVVAQTKTENI
jgi:trehalose utilization protein